MSTEGLLDELMVIDWSSYETAYGSAEAVPHLIVSLWSDDHEEALHGAHTLWASLCHQLAYVSSAALPALPFILRALDDSSGDLAVELLDIMQGFAVCTKGDPAEQPEWQQHLRRELVSQQHVIRRWVGGPNRDADSIARNVLALIDV